MNSRLSPWLLVFVALVPHVAAQAVDPPVRRNVLFILTDDQRPDTIRAFGQPAIRTPHLDRLVREGTAFTRAITAIPICVASRAEILTGRNGLANGKADFGFTPAKDAVFWAEAMRRAGYETCYTGKWHTPGRPSAAGYVRTEGLYAGGRAKRPLTNPTDGQGRPVTGYVGWTFQTDDGRDFPEEGVGLTPRTTTQLGDAAVRFLEAKRDAPFFLHVNFTAPHDPLHPLPDKNLAYDAAVMPLPNFRPEHPFDHGNARGRDELLFAFPRTEAEVLAELALYYANISDVDRQVGRMLQALEAAGQLENTLVIFTSDHGLAIGSHGLRGKQNIYEHTIGVPLLMRGPEIPPGKRLPAQCYLRDLYPTVCDLTGAPIPETVQGKSLKPVLTGAQAQVHDAVFAHFRDSQRMIRTERWKYVVYPPVNREQLFDVVDDPEELHDRSADPLQAGVLADLRMRLTAWRGDNNDPTLNERERR